MNTNSTQTTLETEGEGTLSNSFYEAKKMDKKIRPIPLMKIDAKILNSTLANSIQQYIKRIIPQKQVGFILEVQDWCNTQKSIKIVQQAKKEVT